MTDNEIIKALECLSGKLMLCGDCKYSDHYHYGECQQAAARDVLDLINRQKAEIECLNKEVKFLTSANENLSSDLTSAKAEIERLEAEVDKQYEQAEADILANMADGGMSCHWCITEHKAEAIKDFAEAYKEQIKSCTGMFTDDGFYVPLDAVLRIVEFCKEQMIGEQE
jgi:hypothetical protein